MLTKQDFKQLEAKFATKEDLCVLDKKIDLVFNTVIELIGDLRDDMLKMMGKLDQNIVDLKSITFRQQNLLENHEVRIRYLESSKNISS